MNGWARLHDVLDETLARLVAEAPASGTRSLMARAMRDGEVLRVASELGLDLGEQRATDETRLLDWAEAAAFQRGTRTGVQAGVLALHWCYLRCVRAAFGDDAGVVEAYVAHTLAMAPDALSRSALSRLRELSAAERLGTTVRH